MRERRFYDRSSGWALSMVGVIAMGLGIFALAVPVRDSASPIALRVGGAAGLLCGIAIGAGGVAVIVLPNTDKRVE